MTRHADSIGTRTCRPARSQEYHGPRVVLVVVLAMVGGNDHGAAKRCGGAWWWPPKCAARRMTQTPIGIRNLSRLGSLLPWAVCTGPIPAAGSRARATPTSNTSWPGPRPMTAGCVRRMPRARDALRPTS